MNSDCRPTFAERLADHLSDQIAKEVCYPYSQGLGGPRYGRVTADEIKDVSVEWDPGETREDYDLSPSLPKLEVDVYLRDGTCIPADPGWVIETLMKRALQ